MKLEGKNIILTGASRGFGRCIANMLWKEGANLILVSRSIFSVYSQFPERKGQIVFRVAIDLADPQSAQKLWQEVNRVWSNVDGLVNNAAIQGPIGKLSLNDPAHWRQTMEVNLFAPVALCRIFTANDRMRPGSKIVNISGGGATRGRPNFTAYATAKTALVRFSECLAMELADKEIDVNCVAPGKLSTCMQQEIINAGPERAGITEYQQAHMTVSDHVMHTAAELVVFLLSDASDGITGRLLAAQWDQWQDLNKNDLLADSYTLRRVAPVE